MNVGKIDKTIRGIIAVAAAAYAFFGFSELSTVPIILYVVAAVMTLTATVGVCLLYKPFGINSCKLDMKSQ